MISHLSFLREARALLVDLLGVDIREDELDETLSQLKITFKSGLILYIKYNEFGEYGYQIIHSPQKNDFSRFDNFDDRWNVSTSPHHFHKRGKRKAVASSMIGNPNHDIPILIKYIKEGKF
ncbi:MAG: hypothetical protein EU529_07460 [Promethearchaeota archaeon]|nr:MAG: hypothetical protein EU529_07460 [Candidatus Lokiarchaeota archaeon]